MLKTGREDIAVLWYASLFRFSLCKSYLTRVWAPVWVNVSNLQSLYQSGWLLRKALIINRRRESCSSCECISLINQHLHAAICVFSDFCLDNWIFYRGFKSACTTVNSLLNLWSHCCIAACKLAQSGRWPSLVPEVVSSSLKWSKMNIVVNWLVFLFSCLLLRIV